MSVNIEWISIIKFSEEYLKNSFNISCPAKTYTFQTENATERDEWIQLIQEAIDKRRGTKEKCITNGCNSQQDLMSCQQCAVKVCSKCINHIKVTVGLKSSLVSLCKRCSESQEQEMIPSIRLDIDSSKLPYGWEEITKGGEKMYTNSITKLSSYLHPVGKPNI